MHVGLDFGTTNSAAALYDGAGVELIPIGRGTATPTLMRSVLFIARDGELRFGSPAVEQYIAGTIGRDIHYARLSLGQLELQFAGTDGTDGKDVHLVHNLYALVDANAPGRLFQSLKLTLADESYTATNVFGQLWTIEQLVAAQLREIKTRIERETRQPITSLTIGRPVHYGATPEQDALALARMRRACELAELPEATFLMEPVAAAYAYAIGLDRPRTVLVFDCGGGTLDITVMALDPAGNHEVLSTDGVVVGGDRLDSRIVMSALLPHFGAGAVLGPQRRPLPAFLLDNLGGWQEIMELATPRTLQIIEEAINLGDRPEQLRTLRTLVRENQGVPLYVEVERAKCRLSAASETTIDLDMGETRLHHTLTRAEFEGLIAAEVRMAGACVDRALEAAGLEAGQIDVVLPTGGSSRIPRFARLLAQRFGEERIRPRDAFTTVVAGLAVAAARSVAPTTMP